MTETVITLEVSGKKIVVKGNGVKELLQKMWEVYNQEK